MRARVATVIGLVVFLVLSGTGISFAYWSTAASVSGSVVTADAADPAATNCSNAVRLTNGGFEAPDVSPSGYQQFVVSAGAVPGWLVQNDTIIEIWRSQLGSTPPEGAQIAELNGTGFGTLYQDVVTTPGQTLRWSIAHRGREGTDAMRVSINASGAALVQQDQWSTPQTAFVRHEGVYVVPAGQTSTRLSLTPVSTAGNNASIGNLIDDVTFGTGPCLQPTSAITNVTRGGSSFFAGDVVEYVTTVPNNGGNHALGSVLSVVLPTTLTYQTGSLQVSGAAFTDATGDDRVDYVAGTRTVTARLGVGATAAAGGSIAPASGTTPLANETTVRLRATTQASGVGAAITYAPTVSYADPLAPGWPITTTSTPATFTPVAGGADSADIAVTVLSSPILTPSQSRQWTFRVTNNGSDPATGVRVAITLPSGVTGATLTATSATCTGTTRCDFTGSIAVGATRDITVTATLPASLSGLYPVIATTSPVVGTTTVDPVAANDSASNDGVPDSTVPTTPTSLTLGTVASTTAALSWTGSTDNGGVVSYRVYANGVQVGSAVSGTSTTVTGLTAGQVYAFTVAAADPLGNLSAVSNQVVALTPFDAATNYRVRFPAGTDLCLAAASTANNGALLTAACAATSAQLWRFASTTDGYFVRPQNTATTRSWFTSNGASGTDIQVSASTNGGRAVWAPVIVWVGTTPYLEFRNAGNGLCLEVTGGSTTAGAVVQQATCAGTAAQRFLVEVSP